MSERDIIDVLYLSTKYGFPEKIRMREEADDAVSWKTIENYLTEYGVSYFQKRCDYEQLANDFKKRVEYEKG